MHEKALQIFGSEAQAEMASSLGRAGRLVERRLEELDTCADGEYQARLKAAALAVYAYFVQRECVGLYNHDDAIYQYAIPGEVLAKVGSF